MIDWIKTSTKLPPMHKRVLIWTQDSRLLDNNDEFVQCYIMERAPEQVCGNHLLPYSYHCENGGWEYGHNVTHWAEVGPPND